ncbi:DUF2231 domain-containing protein [Cyclobacterium amurskyense]|uniref:Cytochrome C n=1 Tax=Cyclobacterium amurskyense TaxID=320787 RepID=A0A0H4PYH9_9BACT|nr:DUF2231 domain-containing protein [Cyclobacterium amurskyense]AKP53477.1 cytochrome C [Cyclobacterium amurskyense]
MKIKYRFIAESTLFVLNILLLYFLLLEQFVEIPYWLQPLGRLHPMVLHFPIGLLFLSMVLEFFRFRKEFEKEQFFQNFLTSLLLVAVITAGIAALMGFFLSLEEGYGGPALNWHKWSGAGIVFFASGLYFSREKLWYKAKVAKISASGLIGLTIMAGHYGAALTHGEDFIFEPIIAAREVVVPIEEAIVFDHLIMPVLEKKCNSCHNPSKAKGELIMTDKVSFLKGGETGKLFESESLEESVLIQRLSLPLEDDDHMPPSGKPQLTPDEKLLLELWIKNNPDFEVKVLALPASDSLRLVATNLINPKAGEKVYEFEMPDEKVLETLNNEYRVIRPLSKGSPALDVTIFNANAYNSNSLKELEPLKNQIVYLSLNKLPVEDEDLKIISQFKNLERLNLNFTNISGKGLESVFTISNLEHLAISGTAITLEDLKPQLGKLKRLQSISVWNTSIDVEDLEPLRNEFSNIQIVAGREGLEGEKIKLNVPMLANQSSIFQDSIALEIGHPIENVTVRYTLDGTEPDSISSPIFEKGKVWLDQTTSVNAKAFKEGWFGSVNTTFSVFKNKYPPDSVNLLTRLNRVHPANGSATFFDGDFGGFNANSPAWANNWAGFSNEDMKLLLSYEQEVEISSVSFNVLVEPETIIFPPSQIEVWGGKNEDDMELMAKLSPDLPSEERKPYIQLITTSFNPAKVKCLMVIAKTVKKIPSWHRNKGRGALLLVDEMFIN